MEGGRWRKVPPLVEGGGGGPGGTCTQVQTITFVVLAILASVGIAMIGYTIKRVDDVNEKLSGLPKQIGSELRDITKTVAESITAAKQQAPQVILLPAPAPVPTPPQKAPN